MAKFEHYEAYITPQQLEQIRAWGAQLREVALQDESVEWTEHDQIILETLGQMKRPEEASA